MAIFGPRRIKKIKKKRFVPPVKVKEISDMLEMKAPLAEQKKEYKTKEPSKPTFAPLFVKLTRFKEILSTLKYLKTTVNSIKRQLSVLNKLEKLKEENLNLLNSDIKKVSDQLHKLDSEFTRPSGYIEDIPELQMQDVESLESTIVDLKEQIEQLKSEVETVA